MASHPIRAKQPPPAGCPDGFQMKIAEKVKASLADSLAALPVTSGCYIYRDAKGDVIYVGKAVNLRSRVRSYFQKGAQHPARTRRLVAAIHSLEWIITDSEVEALILECNLIKKHRPYYNVRLRDDKSYPYICVTVSEPYPRVFFTRRPRLTRDGNRYFGPYTDARSVRDTLRTVRRIFGVQSCNHRFTGEEKLRPCLYYHLNQCLGPCTGQLSRAEYNKAVEQVCLLFEGRHEDILRRIGEQMEQAAASLQFERAALLRDRIRALERLGERQKVFTVDQVDQDIIGIARSGPDTLIYVFFVRSGRLIGRESFTMESAEDEPDEAVIGQFLKQYYEGAAAIPASILVPAMPEDADAISEWLTGRRGRKSRVHCPARGEKRRMVELVSKNAQIALDQQNLRGIADRARAEDACLDLGEALGIEMPPVRIECYDISNLQGGYAVGSMVVFEGGRPAKGQYRQFRIRTVDGQDDFASMKEVIGRRLKRAQDSDDRFADLPDLMLIDGGKGQLAAALEAVADSNEEGIALASLAKREEEVFVPGRPDAIRLPRHTPGLRLLQHIRDEAHRFALAYHRKLRGKGSLHSELDDVPGIGPTRRTRLIRAFGSLEAIRKASRDDLAKAPGMNKTAAARLYERLHGDTNDEQTDAS